MLRHCAVLLLIQVKYNVGKRIVELSLIRINTLMEAGLQPFGLGGYLRSVVSNREKSED
jgi:hypothetical protein